MTIKFRILNYMKMILNKKISPRLVNFSCRFIASDSQLELLNIYDPMTKLKFQNSVKSSTSIRPEKLLKKLPKVTEKRRDSAVLIPIIELKGEPSIIFTLRSNNLANHRGEVSFPGGRIEEGESNIRAALRETREEIGLHEEDVDLWAQLSPTVTRDGRTLVHPVVGVVNRKVNIDDLTPHEHEVALVFTKPISYLIQPSNFGYTQFRLKGQQIGYSLPFFEGPPRIWGLSAIILHQFLRLLLSESYSGNLQYSRPINK